MLATLGLDNAHSLLLHQGFLYWSSTETSGMANVKISRMPSTGGEIEILRREREEGAQLSAHDAKAR